MYTLDLVYHTVSTHAIIFLKIFINDLTIRKFKNFSAKKVFLQSSIREANRLKLRTFFVFCSSRDNDVEKNLININSDLIDSYIFKVCNFQFLHKKFKEEIAIFFLNTQISADLFKF